MLENSGNLDNTQDDVLVMRAKDGDQDAFAILSLRYKEDAYKSVMRVVHNDEIVKDLLQDTYIKAWRHIEGLNKPLQFKSWFVVIARNLAIDWLRQNLRRRTVSLEENGIGFEPIDENADPQVVMEREYIRGILAKIEPPVLRDILILHTIRGFSRAEVAHLLGYTEGSVTTYLSQARKQFRKLCCMMDHINETRKEK